MADGEWIDKVSLKKKWGIDEARLVEFVMEGTLIAYRRIGDIYDRLSLTREVVFEKLECHPTRWMGDRPITVKYRQDVRWTKEDIASFLRTFVWFNKINVDDAEYEKKIDLPEKLPEEKSDMSVKEAGRKGGSKREKNQAILSALQEYLEQYPLTPNSTTEEICDTFMKRYNGESKACKVTVNGDPWEVFCGKNHVFTRSNVRYDGKRPQNKERSIRTATFLRYISDMKKLYFSKKTRKSVNPS